MTAFEIEQANRSIGIAVSALDTIEHMRKLPIPERIAYAQAHATLAVAWLQLDAARGVEVVRVEGE